MSSSRDAWRSLHPPDPKESDPCDTSSLQMRSGTCMIGASHGMSCSNWARAVPLSPTPCGSLPPTICETAPRSSRSDRRLLLLTSRVRSDGDVLGRSLALRNYEVSIDLLHHILDLRNEM